MPKESKVKTKWGRKQSIAAIVAAVSALSVITILAFSVLNTNREEAVITINEDVRIAAKIADTQEERRIGLSGRDSLGERQGMLFVFNGSDNQGIWMKDMKFAIDVFWLDEQKQVIAIIEDMRPETYPKIFQPTDEAAYVLEVQSGFAQKHGVEVGNELVFEL